MLIAGVDEAGRGPVIGPMVLACVVIEEKDESKLEKIGVRDSKLVRPDKRAELAEQIKKLAVSYDSICLSAKDIDDLRKYTNLNEIEAMKVANLLERTKPAKAIIDSPDPKGGHGFSTRIKRYLNEPVELQSENFADANYPVVSAASILAKVERDAEIEKLSKIHGFMGSGYPHDEDTVKFLNTWLAKNKRFPDFVRHSWETALRMIIEKQQTKLEDFF